MINSRKLLLVLMFTAPLASCSSTQVQNHIPKTEISDSDGLNIHWVTEGEGRTIMFVHGWTHNMSTWTKQMDVFKEDYQVVALDLPGHGQSDAPAGDEFTLETYFNALEAVRNDAGADKVVLVGHSMGAALVAQYARSYPEHVAGLVWVDGPAITESLEELPADPPPPLVFNRQMREGIINSFFVPETPTEVKESALNIMLKPSDELASSIIKPFVAAPENWVGFHVDTVMLGVIAGNSSLPDSDIAGEVYPNASFTQLPDTGHFLMMEKPDEFNKLMYGFLDEIGY